MPETVVGIGKHQRLRMHTENIRRTLAFLTFYFFVSSTDDFALFLLQLSGISDHGLPLQLAYTLASFRLSRMHRLLW